MAQHRDIPSAFPIGAMCLAKQEKRPFVPPLETYYRHWKFRSRTEARWAVLFDSLSITFEYEREGYALRSGWYLPDFFLPKVSMWAEVKGTEFEREELQKCADLAIHTKCGVLQLAGQPDFRHYRGFTWDGTVLDSHEFCIDIYQYGRQHYEKGHLYAQPEPLTEKQFSSEYQGAVRKALSERFHRFPSIGNEPFNLTDEQMARLVEGDI
jgi:hypothetical protein